MQPIFLNRVQELKFLNSLYDKKGFQLAVLYGRRRIGKTEIIKQFMKGRRGKYFLLTNESVKENIKYLKEGLAELLNKDHLKNIGFENLYDLFSTIADQLPPNKIIIALDEFPYLLETGKGVLSTMQKIIDELLSQKNILLIISGSSLTMMEQDILGYRSPLYGRSLNHWKVQPFGLEVLLGQLKDIRTTAEASFTFGRIPYYFLFYDKTKPLAENIEENFLTKGQNLYDEPLILLRQEFKETRTYKLILRYISQGYRTIGKLCSMTGHDKSNLSKYLDTLQETNLIRHIIPYGMKRKGIYVISDPLMDFWFRYVYPHRSELEIGRKEKVLEGFKQTKKQYFGYRFEYLIEDLIRQGCFKDIDHLHIGKWWHKDKEIDIIGTDDKRMLLAECKWKDKVNPQPILQELEEKSQHLPQGSRNTEYAIFAKSFTKKTKRHKGKNVHCHDLKDIRRALEQKF